MRLALRAVLATLAASLTLALPALAHAATYCVNSPGCTGTSETTLQAALTAAQGTTTVSDTVVVGDPGPPTAGGYQYTDGGASTNEVSIAGAGPATTLLTRTTPGDVLTLIGPGSTISGLTVQLPAGSSDGVVTSGSLDNVNITTLDSGSGSQAGADFLSGGTSEHWIGGRLAFPDGTGSRVGVINGLGSGRTLDLENLTIGDVSEGVISGPGNTTIVRRASVTAGLGFPADGDQMTLDDVAFRAVGGPGVFATAEPASGDNALLNLNHVSAFGQGTSGIPGIVAETSASGVSATVIMRNSIIRNFFLDCLRNADGSGAVANISASYSDFSPIHCEDENNSGGTGSITVGPGLVDDDPRFANPAAGDFSLLAGSPAIDAGDPAGLAASDSTTDLLGAPRISNGRQDMGAVEFQFVPPVPPPAPDTTPPTLKTSKLPKTLKFKRLLAGLSFTVTPSEPSAITATLAGAASSVKLAKNYNLTLAHKSLRLAPGRRRITLKVKRKLLGKSRKFTLKLTVVATDAAGNKRTLTHTIKVRK
jgi:hypothetical protein